MDSSAALRGIGRYRIRREIGRGTMSTVYEAHDPALGRTVALKTIEIRFALSPGERAAFEERFLAEARIAAMLSHPGIVAVHDAGRDGPSGTLYIALEYLEGRTLAEVLRRGDALDWRPALSIVRGVAAALAHAHERGVVHRDVKPANIMLLRSGGAKVLDFGIAKVEGAGARLTAPGQVLGTPLYVSPEQARAEPVDRRTDIFALGAVVYLLLTGRTAFGAESVPQVLARVVRDDPPPASSLVEVPPDVDLVLALALAKDRHDRYADAHLLSEDLRLDDPELRRFPFLYAGSGPDAGRSSDKRGCQGG